VKRLSINVVVTCTKRKTTRAPARLRLGQIRTVDPKRRCAAWIRALSELSSVVIPAVDLYCGDQWQVVRSLRDVGASKSINVNLWVCSAGYGLIQADSKVQPYSATFSSGHVDSVCRSDNGKCEAVHSEWWNSLANWQGPNPGQPRSLAQLAATFPLRPIIVVASPTYLAAVQSDLAAAQEELQSPELLAIVSAGAESLGALNESKIPCNGRFQHALGGALMSLNPRVAREVIVWLGSHAWNLEALKRHFAGKLARQPDSPRYERTPMSDEDVRQFVLEEYPRHSMPSASRLLRVLRDSGFACEQKRFSRLFAQIQESKNGR
jgi:hypothetical protein